MCTLKQKYIYIYKCNFSSVTSNLAIVYRPWRIRAHTCVRYPMPLINSRRVMKHPSERGIERESARAIARSLRFLSPHLPSITRFPFTLIRSRALGSFRCSLAIRQWLRALATIQRGSRLPHRRCSRYTQISCGHEYIACAIPECTVRSETDRASARSLRSRLAQSWKLNFLECRT